MTDRYDVLILGAGVAGLSAALSLIAAGVRPLVLEAAKKPGGRASSFHDRTFGEELDNGPHLLIGAYHSTLRLLDTLGTGHLLHGPKRVEYDFWSREHGHYRLRCPDLPVPLNLVAGIWNFAPFSIKDRLAAMGLGAALLKGRDSLEEQSVTQWLHAHGQSGAPFTELWSPLCLAALNEPAASANAALYAEVLRRAFFSGRNAARPLIPTVPLSKLIAEPARDHINANGGSLLCGHRVRKIHVSGDRVTGIVTNRGDFTAPKALIAALPYGPLADLLPEWGQKAGFAAIPSAPIVSVHLAYDGPGRLPAPLMGMPHGTSQWLFDRNGGGGKQGQGARLSAVLSGAYRECSLDRKELVATVAAEVGDLLPGLKPSRLVAARVIKERRATFAPWPGVTKMRPSAVTPWRNLALAGDWTTTELPATLEGAVVSGELAARNILAFIGTHG